MAEYRLVPDNAYVGTELDVFAGATNWRGYWARQVSPYLGSDVVEVGAGIGSVMRALCTTRIKRWTALEPDPSMARKLADVASDLNLTQVTVLSGIVRSLPESDLFDAAVYIDVMEHIEDDVTEMMEVSRHIRPGGHVIVLSPAHQALYTEFDRAIGHCRRYDRSSLRRIGPPGFNLVALKYLDSVGMLASLGNKYFLKSGSPTYGQIQFWDKCLVPMSRLLDPLLGYRVGKSILAVWQKT